MAETDPNAPTIIRRIREGNSARRAIIEKDLNSFGKDPEPSKVSVTNATLPVQFEGAQPVTVESQPTAVVSNFPASQPVSGTVSVGNTPNVGVTNFPANQPVSGTVDVGLPVSPNGRVAVLATPLEYVVAQHGTIYEEGVNKAAFSFRVLGRRAGFNSTTASQDVGEWLGIAINELPELDGTESLELVSSSALDDDSPGGTGTRVVRICYLTPGYVLTTVNYSLNGTVVVPVAEKMRFIYYMEAFSGGTADAAQGNVDLRIAGGGAVQERITASNNKSLSGRVMVPDNYRGYISQWCCTAIGGAQIDCRLRATVTTLSRALGTKYLIQDSSFVTMGSIAAKNLGYVQYPARCRIKVSVLPSGTAASNRIDSTFNILFIQD